VRFLTADVHSGAVIFSSWSLVEIHLEIEVKIATVWSVLGSDRQAPEDHDELKTRDESHKDDQVDDTIAKMKRKQK
jgi:hypothetical protein